MKPDLAKDLCEERHRRTRPCATCKRDAERVIAILLTDRDLRHRTTTIKE